jgi:hypothetical protein
MVWWIVDNNSVVLLVLGIIALGFAALWWTRRNNKLLIGVGVPLVLMLLTWVLSQYIVTDRIQLARDVETMRDLINAGKLDEAIGHFADEIKIDTSQGEQTFKKAEIAALAKLNMKRYGVKKVVTNKIEVQEVNRPKATVTFYVGPEDSGDRGRCIMGFELADGKWRVRTFTVESVIGGQKSPLVFPF